MELGEDTAGAKRAAEDAGDGAPDAKVARVDGEPAGAATRGLPRDVGPAPRVTCGGHAAQGPGGRTLALPSHASHALLSRAPRHPCGRSPAAPYVCASHAWLCWFCLPSANRERYPGQRPGGSV